MGSWGYLQDVQEHFGSLGCIACSHQSTWQELVVHIPEVPEVPAVPDQVWLLGILVVHI